MSVDWRFAGAKPPYRSTVLILVGHLQFGVGKLMTIIKTVLRYAILCIGLIVTFAILSNIYIYQTGEAAREFCTLVSNGMSSEKLQALAAEKGLDVVHKNIKHQDIQYIFSTKPNRESKCTVVISEGNVIGKKYSQHL